MVIYKGVQLTIELVQYKEKYAKGLADMWNRSADAWGGKTSVDTEETIIQKEKNSTFLDLTLAKDGQAIVGYCKLSVDHNDEGALYIDLLNVRPDYHGKSIGKQLLLDSLEKTIKRGWRRLDLLTWPGNTKAIPLYKKCGFFWEKRDNTTHLINLIPDVLSCELVEDYFKVADWYKDSSRAIEVTPDSELVNDFDLWRYTWLKHDKKLEMVYSRRGRGLRMIDHEDYKIEMIVENVKLVFGDHYEVKYVLTNKTDKALDIHIKGMDDKNIKFDFETSFALEHTKEVKASFFVDKIQKKQAVHHTHPLVKSMVEVNGKKACFMTGVEPVFPAEVTFKTERDMQMLGVKSPCYIDVVNETGGQATFEFTINNCHAFSLGQNDFRVSLEKGEKASLKSTIVVHSSSLVCPSIDYKTIRQDKDDIYFDRPLKIFLPSDYGKYHGTCDNFYTMGIGKHCIVLKKDTNTLEFKDLRSGMTSGAYAPKVGKPFSQEFEKKPCQGVEFTSSNDWIQMAIQYVSDDFKGLAFKRMVRLHGNGFLKMWYIFENQDQKERTVAYEDGIFFVPKSVVVAYDGQVVSLENENSDSISYIEGARVDENWLCTQGLGRSCAFVWPKAYDFSILGWHPSVGHTFKLGGQGDTYQTQAMVLGHNAFSDWHEVREFALGKSLDKEEVVLASDVEINGGNPFVKDGFKALYREHKKVNQKGHMKVKLENQSHEREAGNALDIKMNENSAVLSIETTIDADVLTREKLIYKTTGETLKTTYTKEDLEVYKVDNGLLQYECAPEFSPSLSSLVYDDTEWLSSAFPKAKSHVWWKAYVGGINVRPIDITLTTMDEASRTCAHVDRVDNFGNTWSGLAITTIIEDHKDFKGLQWTQYYLTQAGVPLVAYFADYKNDIKAFHKNKRFFDELFLTLPKDEGGAFIHFTDPKGRQQEVLSGTYDRDTSTGGLLEFHLKEKTSFMTLMKVGRSASLTFQMGVGFVGAWGIDSFSVASGQIKRIAPKYLFFGEKSLKEDWLRDFKKIKF